MPDDHGNGIVSNRSRPSPLAAWNHSTTTNCTSSLDPGNNFPAWLQVLVADLLAECARSRRLQQLLEGGALGVTGGGACGGVAQSAADGAQLPYRRVEFVRFVGQQLSVDIGHAVGREHRVDFVQ